MSLWQFDYLHSGNLDLHYVPAALSFDINQREYIIQVKSGKLAGSPFSPITTNIGQSGTFIGITHGVRAEMTVDENNPLSPDIVVNPGMFRRQLTISSAIM